MLKAPWVHTSQLRPCPICGRGKGGNRCILIPDEVVQCYYTPSKMPRKTTAGDAWLHFLRERPERERPTNRRRIIVRRATPSRPDVGLPKLAGKFQMHLTPDRLRALGHTLGVSCGSLKRLCAGWTNGEMMFIASRGEERAINAWSFPRRDADGRVTGISLRPMWGRKFTWTGSGGGLHIPTGFEPGGRGILCEGPSDTAAALDLGLNAFGRSSCASDVEEVIRFIRAHELTQLIIFSQRDDAHYRADGSAYYPAQDGAEDLARQARLFAPDVRIIMPPEHEGDKDVRDWLRRGATATDIEQLINNAEPRAMRVVVRMHHRKGMHTCHTTAI